MRNAILRVFSVIALTIGLSGAAQAQLKTAHLGGNQVGTVTDNGGGSFTIVGGGNDIWETADELTYSYKEVVGDFDVQVRVESFTPNARWSKAGIMARESLSEACRMAFVRVTPADVPTSSGGNGANDVFLSYRTGFLNNGGVNGGAHEDRDAANPLTTPSYPNAWIRMARIGNVIYASNSLDGVTWNFVSSQDTATWFGGALPPNILLGLVASRHSGGATATAEFRNYSLSQASSAQFNVTGASSRGHPSGVTTYFNRQPGAGSTTAANYGLTGPLGTIVTGLRLTTANDATERDPMTFTLEGTTGTPAAGPWTLIASGNTGLGLPRNTTAPDISFANSTPYTSYRIIFPTVRDAGAANSMQIAEVEMLGPGGSDVISPGDPLIPSSLNSPMPGEVAAKAIDNDLNTKYLNFDKLNTGFTVTPSLGASPATVLGASTVAWSPNVIQLATSPLVEGITYTLNADPFFIMDAGGGPMINGTATFTHGAGYETLRIRVNHSHTDNGGAYVNGQAVKRGLGETTPIGGGTFPGTQANNVFEDPIPDDGVNEQFSTRVSGVLNITTSGNYTFYMSSDDVGYLYLSSNDDPANKVLIANEPAWNGRREYIAGGNQATRGGPPSNISTPKSLVAGKKYYLELVFTEGGGGNNGSATWLPPGGPAVANGSSPIPEENFTPSRQFDGSVFSALGPVQIVTQPANSSIPAASTGSFSVRADGTPGYSYQWRRKGPGDPGFTDIAGANGQTYTTPLTTVADNGAQYLVVVANEFSSATSSAATLTVTVDTTRPTIIGAAGGSAYALDATHMGVRFSEPVNAADAVDLGNYSLPGYVLSSPVLLGDNITVVFTVAPSLKTPTCKTLTVNNVRDRATPTGNPILPNSTVGVVYAEGSSRYSRFNTGGFPGRPDVIAHPPLIENPEGGGNHGDNYVSQALVLIAPPVTGNYKFYIAADDGATLFLSTDENPANKIQIAREPEWGGFRAYTGPDKDGNAANDARDNPPASLANPANVSASINLIAGCRYYLEVVHNEGGGGDYFSVAWQTPAGGPNPGVPANGSVPIGALYISPYETAPTIAVTDPVDQTLLEGRRALLTVGVTGSPNLSYQWFSNGVAIVDATNATHNTATLRFPANSGDHYRVVVANSLGSVTSRDNTITVQDDSTAPHLLSAEGNATFDRITLRFDEPIEPGSAVDTFNYGLSPSATILSAMIGADGMSVILIIDPSTPLAENTLYTVTVNGVNDQALPPNTIAANSTVQFRTFVFSCGFLLFQAYDTASSPGNAVSLLTGHPNFPNNPRDTAFIKSFNSREAYPNDSHEQYGGRISGVFVPPVTGNYLFYLASDDASQLFLNPAGKDAAGKVLLTEETGCCNPFSAHASGPQALLAGQAYYIEGLYKEGGGGDFMQVAAKLDTNPADPNSLSPIGAGSIGIYAPPVNATFNFTQQPATQQKFENQTVNFSVAATVSGAAVTQPSIQWQRSDDGGATWANIPGANSSTYSKSFLTIANDHNDRFRAMLCVPGASALSDVAILTVIVDDQPPKVVSCAGSGTMGSFTIVFDEPVELGSATDPFNYSISDGANPLNITGFSLAADAQTLTISTDRQNENTLYTITINSVNDIASPPNTIAPNTTVTCRSFVFSCGFVVFETYNTPVGGTAVSLLTSSPDYPNNPRERFLIPTMDTRNAYPNDSHEQFGGRITGLFAPATSGDYIFYLRSDDASELWLNPSGPDAGGAVKIQEELGCCGAFSGHATAPQALTAGQRYFIMVLYKEGGGGDYAQVAAKLATSPTNPDSLSPIGSGSLGLFADPVGANLTITQQPTSQNLCLIAGAEPGDAGFTVENPTGAFESPWAYDVASGSWRESGQAAENSHPNSSKLHSRIFTVTQAGHVELSFNHRWSFEFDGTAWDGGQVRINVNGAGYVMVPGASFTQNGYNGTIAPNTIAELHGQPGYISQSPGYASPNPFVTSVADLGVFSVGDTIVVEFFASNDSNTRGSVPNWEIDSFALSGGINRSISFDSSTVTFAVGANASIQNVPNQAIFYQWQRNSGGGFTDIPGANGSSYTLSPSLSDNGACFRAILCIPGATKTTATACLTVIQANTPPQFTCGPNQVVDEDAGPQSLPGWAGSVQPDSIGAVLGSFHAAFTSGPPSPGPSPYVADFSAGLPAGTVPSGTTPPYVAGGVLHITDQVNGQANFWQIPSLGSQTVTTFHGSWKTLIQGVGGADGVSFNMGVDLGTGFTPEEGAGNGLSVQVDTYNNGSADAGVEIKWNGARIGFVPVGPGVDGQGAPAELATGTFVDSTVDVTATGGVTFKHGLYTVTGQIPGYTGITFNQYLFAARTGGANENAWIDDLSLSAAPIVGAPAPAGSAVFGNAYIADGALHLTDAANGQIGSFVVNDLLGGSPLGSFTMTFDALVGMGTTPPADGFSVSIANNIPNAPFGEDGAGTGLTVVFDSYDNGGGEAPAIDVMWGGFVIAHTLIPTGLETGGQFVPVSIKLDPDGTLDVSAAGFPVYTDLATGYIPISGARFGLGGRTGGLNERNWVKNLDISATAVNAGDAEANQIVTFTVSNDNPGLFATQPSVSSDGTLTYAANANACGIAHVTVVAKDSGGTVCNGDDTSDPCLFTITVRPVDDCPIGFPQSRSVNEDSSIGIVLGAFDGDSAGSCGLSTLTYTIVTPPAHGTLSGTAPNLVYTPTPGYPSGCGHNNGGDSFSYTVSDGECTSPAATITIVVVEVNDCPTAIVEVTPLCVLPGVSGLTIISGNNSNACVILDGRHSSDPECDPITYSWYVAGSPVAFSTSSLTTNCFPLGTHHITLSVNDGQCDGIAQVTVEIVTACEAIEALIDDINNSNLTRKNKRPFLASLKAACASFERGSYGSGQNQLKAFMNKVRAQVSRDNPVEAARFIAQAQAIIDGIKCAEELNALMHP